MKFLCTICNGEVTATDYAGGECSKCGRAYKYDEGFMVILTEKDKELLREVR